MKIEVIPMSLKEGKLGEKHTAFERKQILFYEDNMKRAILSKHKVMQKCP